MTFTNPQLSKFVLWIASAGVLATISSYGYTYSVDTALSKDVVSTARVEERVMHIDKEMSEVMAMQKDMQNQLTRIESRMR